MDPIWRDTVFAGFTFREIAEAVAVEMRRRNLLGCVYMFPETGGAGVFASTAPSGVLSGLSASQQLSIFSEVAAHSLSETSTTISEESDDTSSRRPN